MNFSLSASHASTIHKWKKDYESIRSCESCLQRFFMPSRFAPLKMDDFNLGNLTAFCGNVPSITRRLIADVGKKLELAKIYVVA
jgi:hypothetical protein